MSYISVADLDATLDKVKKLGGTVIVPKTTAGDMGSFAIIQRTLLVRILLSGNRPKKLCNFC